MITIAVGIILAIIILFILFYILAYMPEIVSILLAIVAIWAIIAYPKLLMSLLILIGLVGILFLLFGFFLMRRKIQEAGNFKNYLYDIAFKRKIAITKNQKSKKLRQLLEMDDRINQNKTKIKTRKEDVTKVKLERLQEKVNIAIEDATVAFHSIDFFSVGLQDQLMTCVLSYSTTGKPNTETYSIAVEWFREPRFIVKSRGHIKEFSKKKQSVKYLQEILRKRVAEIRSLRDKG